MAVVCPGCGQEYDLTLLQFGRVVRCACGRSVSLEERVVNLPGSEPAFAADAMLGRLAKWLRLLGYDTLYAPALDDQALVRRARAEDRTVLTRDRALVEELRPERVLLVASESLEAQLRQVVTALRLDWRTGLLSRCSRCNGALREVSSEAVRELVPERVLASRERFLQCSGCDRVYWRGSHIRRMSAVLERALGETIE